MHLITGANISQSADTDIITVTNLTLTVGANSDLTTGTNVVTNFAGKLIGEDMKLGEVKTDNGGVDLETANGSIVDNNGDALNILAITDSKLAAHGGIIGSVDDPIDVHIIGEKLSVLAAEDYRLISVDINGVVKPSDTLDALNVPPGLIIFNNRMLGDGITEGR